MVATGSSTGGSATASGPHVARDGERRDQHRRERHDAVVRGVGGRDPQEQHGADEREHRDREAAAPQERDRVRQRHQDPERGGAGAVDRDGLHERPQGDGPGDRQVDRLRHAKGALDAGDVLHARIVGGGAPPAASSRGRIRMRPWSHAVAPPGRAGRDRGPTRRRGSLAEPSPRRRHGPSRTGGAHHVRSPVPPLPRPGRRPDRRPRRRRHGRHRRALRHPPRSPARQGRERGRAHRPGAPGGHPDPRDPRRRSPSAAAPAPSWAAAPPSWP